MAPSTSRATRSKPGNMGQLKLPLHSVHAPRPVAVPTLVPTLLPTLQLGVVERRVVSLAA